MDDGKPRSSPSDINTFLAEPAAWFLKRFADYRTESGAAAHRGSAVEFGLTYHLLHSSPVNQKTLAGLESEEYTVPIGAVYEKDGERYVKTDKEDQGVDLKVMERATGYDYAMTRFRQLTGGEISDEIEAEAQNIRPMYQQAVDAFRDTGTLLTTQTRVESEIEGIVVRGYLDFTFSGPPAALVDLKTTKRMPSQPRTEHIRQVSFYSHVTGLPAKLCYVTPKKWQWFDVEPIEQQRAFRHIRAACRAMRRILSERDWRESAQLYPPRDPGSFYYDDVSRLLVEQVWEL